MNTLCVCGHNKERHFAGVYNCGDCPGDEDCVMFQASLHGNPIRKAAAVPPIPAAATGHKEQT